VSRDAYFKPGLCVHGLAGGCPDCVPTFADSNDPLQGAPTAWVREKREEGWVVVHRQNADGTLGCATWHFTRWGARRAARLFERTGKTRGFKP
jgi:hypothetical protein